MRANLLALVTIVGLCGCDSGDSSTSTGGDLNSVLWIQTSAEYRATCRQTFRAATDALPQRIATPTHSAALEQTGDCAHKRPAVILDIDETVLDNSPYNARLLRDRGTYDQESWAVWVRDRRAEPLAGAREFIDACKKHGVTVFCVTNRDASLEAETRANLDQHGIRLDDPTIDQLRMRNEYDDSGSEKTLRRSAIAADFRIVMLVGDDLGDFVPHARQATLEERAAHTERFADRWGHSWFVLPNPIYGSWLRRLGDDPAAHLDTAD